MRSTGAVGAGSGDDASNAGGAGECIGTFTGGMGCVRVSGLETTGGRSVSGSISAAAETASAATAGTGGDAGAAGGGADATAGLAFKGAVDGGRDAATTAGAGAAEAVGTAGAAAATGTLASLLPVPVSVFFIDARLLDGGAS